MMGGDGLAWGVGGVAAFLAVGLVALWINRRCQRRRENERVVALLRKHVVRGQPAVLSAGLAVRFHPIHAPDLPRLRVQRWP